jgi:hypothetical protein
LGDSIRFDINDQVIFFMVKGDVGGASSADMFALASQKVGQRLALAIQEFYEARAPKSLAIAAAYVTAETLIGWLVLHLLFLGRHRLTRRAEAALSAKQSASESANANGKVLATYAGGIKSASRWLLGTMTWAAALVVLDLWATFSLRQFAYTRPWGERATDWLLEVVQQFSRGFFGRYPDC